MIPLDNCISIQNVDTFIPTPYGKVEEVGKNTDGHPIKKGDIILFAKNSNTEYKELFYVHWTDVYAIKKDDWQILGNYLTVTPPSVEHEQGEPCEYTVLSVGEKVTYVKSKQKIVAKVMQKKVFEDMWLIDEQDVLCIVE
jgi:co-chaperonin GroES (HSP10)